MTQSSPLVSVVTPVYNGERYLAECIESVLAQTYQNWEYIIVNNFSQDSTLEIAEQYAGRDPRIRIHSNQELVDIVRNHHIALAQTSSQSKYCKIVHADDCLFPECITRMVERAEENPRIGVVGAYALNGVRISWHGLPYGSTVISGHEICRRTLLREFYLFGSPTSTLIRSDLIRRRLPHFYNESNNAHFDEEACFEVLQDNDFGFVQQVLTYTREHDESLTVSLSRALNTYLPGKLRMLLKYGPVYLEPEELDRCLRLKLREYYRFLGKSALKLEGRKFWEYHRSELANLDLPLSRWRTLAGACSELMDLIFNPQTTVEKLIKKVAASH